MSELEELEVTPRDLEQQNPPVEAATEIVVDDSGAQPTYANFCRATATPEEVILDFGLNPLSRSRRVVRSSRRPTGSQTMPDTTKRLMEAIGTTIQRHEQTFGAIELDVGRPVSPLQPRFTPAEDRGPAGQPEVIRLR